MTNFWSSTKPAKPSRGPAYELWAELGHGDTVGAELPVGPQRGAPVRVERDGEVIFEDNIGFDLFCQPGEWAGGLTLATVFDDTYLRTAAVHPDPDAVPYDLCRDP